MFDLENNVALRVEELIKNANEILEEKICKVLGKGIAAKVQPPENINGIYKRANMKIKIDLSRKDQVDEDGKYPYHICVDLKPMPTEILEEKRLHLQRSNAVNRSLQSGHISHSYSDSDEDISGIYKKYNKNKQDLSRSLEELEEENIDQHNSVHDIFSDTDEELMEEDKHLETHKENSINHSKRSLFGKDLGINKRRRPGTSKSSSIRIQLIFPNLRQNVDHILFIGSPPTIADNFVDISWYAK